MTRWYEDVEIDRRFPLGEHTFTAGEITRFGTLYDPQYFHVDAEDARHSHFGGQVASGWHTVCIGHRKMVDALFAEGERLRAAGQEPGVFGPSPGINRMDFKTPVRPGDTVSYTLTVTGKRPSNSLPGWGLLFNLIEAHNQHGELVYSADLVGLSRRRDYRPSLRVKLAQWALRQPWLRPLLRK